MSGNACQLNRSTQHFVEVYSRVVGERAEILLRLSAEKAVPAVLWTDGVKFHEMYSSSRDCVLELEKVY
jgi:hypothetical protein